MSSPRVLAVYITAPLAASVNIAAGSPAVASQGEPSAVATERPFTDEPQLLPEAESSGGDPILTQKVARLLEVAEAHAAFGRLKDPPGFNAYDAYQQVLELDPDNEAALRGLADLERNGAAMSR